MRRFDEPVGVVAKPAGDASGAQPGHHVVQQFRIFTYIGCDRIKCVRGGVCY